MKVAPFCQLPERAKKMVICNLQETPKDNKAKMIVRAKTDDFMIALFKVILVTIDKKLRKK